MPAPANGAPTIGRRAAILAGGSMLVMPAIVKAAAEPIRIGSVLSTTGPAAWLGDPEDKTLRMVVEKLNAEGGVLGRPIALSIYDDGSEAAKANSFTKRLIQQDQIDIFVGGSSTGSTMAIMPLTEAAKITMLSFGAANAIVQPIRPNVFKIPQSDTLAARAVLDDMKRRELTRFALASDTGGFGKSGRTEVIQAAKEMGMTIVADEAFGERDTDMTPMLTRVRNTDAQAVFMFGTGQAPAIIAQNYRQLGIKLPLYATHSQASYEFIRIAGAAGEGIRLPTPALLIADDLSQNDPQRQICIDYRTAYEARFKTDVSTFGGYALDGLMIAVAAIKRAGSTDKQKIADAILQTKEHAGVTGTFTFSPTDHNGLDTRSLWMVEVKNGKFVKVS